MVGSDVFAGIGPAGATTAVGAEVAVSEPKALAARTRTRMVEPTSSRSSPYVARLPPTPLQSLPDVLQRNQSYLNEVGFPLHDPFVAVSVWPALAAPAIVGGDVFFGLSPLATTPVAAETAFAEPSPFVAVTDTRIVRPTSSRTSLYAWFVAFEMFEHFPPSDLHRCQRYAKEIGVDPDQLPLAAVSVSPSFGVPEIVGSEVLAGAAFRAPCAPAPERSTAAAISATYLTMSTSFPTQQRPKEHQTKCLRPLKPGITSRGRSENRGGTMGRNLEETARALVAPGKGILAADESSGTIKKRFDSIDVESTEENRRAYRDMLFTTEGAADYISGVILYDETIRQSSHDGTPFPKLLESQGIIPGIKVDIGAKPLANAPGETVTEGLDGLRERCEEYRELGARFAKWRAVITIGDGIPSEYCIWTNAHALARYAAIAQEAGLVPIVEPEVLMDGDHSIETSFDVTSRTLHAVFTELRDQRVHFEQMLLKPNMVLS